MIRALRIFAILAVLAAPQARAGTGSHGGDAGVGLADSAWFADAFREIKFCVSKAPEFPYDNAYLAKHVRDGFAAWQSYYNAKVIRSSDHGPGHYCSIGEVCQGLSFALSEVSCSDPHVDLQFVFGGTLDLLKTKGILGKRSSEFLGLKAPIGLALPQGEYSAVKLWGKGLIWLANPGSIEFPTSALNQNGPGGDRKHELTWKEPIGGGLTSLDVLLRHEIGHALGNGHHRGTLMDEAIAVRLMMRICGFDCTEDVNQIPGEGLFAIDQEAELASDARGDEPGDAFPFLRSVGLNWDSINEPNRWFKVLSEHDAVGLIRGSLWTARGDSEIHIELDDESGRHFTAKFEETRRKAVESDVSPLVFRLDLGGARSYGSSATRFMSFGRLVASSGHSVDCIVERNNNAKAPFAMDLTLAPLDSVELLFSASP